MLIISSSRNGILDGRSFFTSQQLPERQFRMSETVAAMIALAMRQIVLSARIITAGLVWLNAADAGLGLLE